MSRPASQPVPSGSSGLSTQSGQAQRTGPHAGAGDSAQRASSHHQATATAPWVPPVQARSHESAKAALQLRGLALVLLAFLAVGVVYSVVVPIFEAPDELHHYFYVRHLASGNPLPVQDPKADQPWAQEGSQPPLYYALAALVTSWVPTDDALLVSRPNWHANMGEPLEPGNKNRIVHTALEDWPYQGTSLAVRLGRWFSLLLGMGTIVAVYAIARRLLPSRPDLALVAAATTAFIPQFIFVSSAVSNDNLVILLSTLAIWQLVRLLQEPHTPVRLLLLGVTLGLAALTKLSGLALLPLALAVLVLQAWRQHRWRDLPRDLLLVLAPLLLIAGWWYWRNWQLYGDATGLNVMLQIVGPREPPPGWAQLPSEFQGLRISFWGLFGWFNVAFPDWVYKVLDALSLVVLAGMLIGLLRIGRKAGAEATRGNGSANGEGFGLRSLQPLYWVILLLSAWIAVMMTALVRWTRLTPGTQGRLIFPAISALIILLVLGWDQLWPRWTGKRAQSVATKEGRTSFLDRLTDLASSALRGGRRVWLAIWPLLLLALSLSAPLSVIAPAYALPPQLGRGDIPESALLAEPILFGDVARLVGAEVGASSVQPGQEVPFTLYWEVLREVPYDLSLFIRLLGRHNEVVGQLDTYPGWGNYATSLWREGEIFADSYRLRVRWDALVPAIVHVDTGLYYAPTQRDVPSRNAAGQPVPSIVGKLRLTPSTTAPSEALKDHSARPTSFNYNGLAALWAYDYSAQELKPGDTLTITLYWQALATMEEDFTVFIHLLGPGLGGSSWDKLTQFDRPPLDGDYPTSAWQPGDLIVDRYTLQIPVDATPGHYRPLVGFYLPATLERVPVDTTPWETNLADGMDDPARFSRSVSGDRGEVRDRGALLPAVSILAGAAGQDTIDADPGSSQSRLRDETMRNENHGS